MERKNTTQRRPIKDTVGFNRIGLIPEEEAPYYNAPEEYPEDARSYLSAITRCGTMSGACKIAGVSVNRVYKWRKEIEDFEDEEQFAKDCLTDALEESLYACGLGSESGMARVKALEAALKSNRASKYDRAQKHEVDAEVNMSWIDIMKQADKDE